jgi:protein transport protein SEC61 subunit alpha
MRPIDVVSPVKHWLPEVDSSVKRITFRDKLLWTAATLVIYLICCQLPLYGVQRLNGMDPLYQMRIIFASKRGTLLISSMILHTLAGTKYMPVQFGSKNDRELFQAA